MSDQNPSVLHIVYNLIRGGTEGQCARVVMAFCRRGARHRIAVFDRTGFFVEPVEQLCGRLQEIRIRHVLRPTTLLEVIRLIRFMRANTFDVVHAWDADAAIFGAWAARWAGLPIVTSRRDLGQIYSERKLSLMRRADRMARRVVVNSEAMRLRLVAQGLPPSKVAMVPNLFDCDTFDRESAIVFSREKELPPGRLIGWVARLDPEKDAATFIRAARLVRDEVPDVAFVVAGDGPERNRLESLRGQLGLNRDLLFLGDVREVSALLRRLAVGVLTPSSNEGLSNSILEYMSAGLPVVATDCGGNRELVENGRIGFVVPCGDAQAVADAIERLLSDPSRAVEMGKAGRQRVQNFYNPNRSIELLSALYADVLNQSGLCQFCCK